MGSHGQNLEGGGHTLVDLPRTELKTIRVSRIILLYDDAVLMMVRSGNPDRGQIEFPGGKIEPNGEGSLQAALRELGEEIIPYLCNPDLLLFTTSVRVVGDIVYSTDYWIAEMEFEKDAIPLCSDSAQEFVLIDIMGNEYSPDDFAFDHYEILQLFAKEVGN